MSNGKVVLTVNEVAKMLGLSRNSTYEGIRRGEIPHIRIGKRLLIPRVALDGMLIKTNAKISDQNLHDR